MIRKRAQAETVFTVILAGLMVLSIPAVVVPTVGPDAMGPGLDDPDQFEIPTTTPPALNQTENTTPVSTAVGTPSVTSIPNHQHDTDTEQVQTQRALTHELQTIQNESQSQRAAALAAADAVLASRQEMIADGRLNLNLATKLATQRTNLRGARSLLNLTKSDAEVDSQSDNLTRAVRLVKVGTKLQVAQLNQSDQSAAPRDVPLLETATPSHDSPSAAAFAILNRSDVTPTAEQTANIRVLDDLPEPTRSELKDVLDAYLGYYITTQEAYANANRTRLRALANTAGAGLSESRDGTLRAVGDETSNESALSHSPVALKAASVDVTRVRAAQFRLLEATAALNIALSQPDAPGVAGPSSHDTITAGDRVAPVLAINLSTHNNTYEDDYMFLLDRGGDDTYHNNAGGGGDPDLTDAVRSAALIDLGGDDNYTGGGPGNYSYGVNGGGYNGAGFLVDTDGNDSYSAGTEGANGGGRLGMGFLVDATGDDAYVAGSRGTNGGANTGIGLLLDAGDGDDTYNATRIIGDTSSGTNGGGLGGNGFLYDGGGSDTYDALSDATNGGGEIGTGFLLDAGDGDDTFTATETGTNGGGGLGVGFLLNEAGSDSYTATRQATNGGGAISGVGLLLDIRGRDTYTALRKGVNGGGDLAVGLLIDTGGTGDKYSDDTRYVVGEDGTSCRDCSRLPKYIAGAQVDLAATDKVPDTGPPSAPATTPAYSADLCVEGLRDSCDGDGTVGQEEDADNDSVYGTIQVAVDAAQPGETIEVRPDTYHEHVTVDTPGLVLVANHSAGLGDVTLDGRAGTGDPRENLVNSVKVQAAAVKLTGFVLQNYTSDEIVISAGANQSLVRENTVHGSIAVTEANGTAIHANRIDQNNSGADALTVATTPAAAVTNNTFTGGGITLTDSPIATVTNNTVEDFSAGDDEGTVGGPGPTGTLSTTAADSSHSDAAAEPVGITVTGGRDVTVADNTVSDLREAGAQDGPVGIAVMATRAPTVTNNSVDALHESGAGDGPVGVAMTDGRTLTVAHNSVTFLNESGGGDGPVGVKLTNITLGEPIAHNRVANVDAGGEGADPVGLTIADSAFQSGPQTFGPNDFETGGVLITNSTLSIRYNNFAENITVVNSTGVVVANNTFHKEVTATDNAYTGTLQITNSTGVVIDNNTFTGQTFEPLTLVGTTESTVVNNSVKNISEFHGWYESKYEADGPVGITVRNAVGTRILQNTVTKLNESFAGDGPLGIKVSDSQSITISNNLINDITEDAIDGSGQKGDGRAGIKVIDSLNVVVAHNTVEGLNENNGGDGPVGLKIWHSSGTTITNNTIENITEDKRSGFGGDGPIGITLLSGSNTTVTDNTLTNLWENEGGKGSVGIAVENASGTTLTNNTLTNFIERKDGTGPVGVTISNVSRPDITNNSISQFNETALDCGSVSKHILGLEAANSTKLTVARNKISDFTSLEKCKPKADRPLQIGYNGTVGTAVDLTSNGQSIVRGNTLTAVNNSVVITSRDSATEVVTNNTFDATRYGVRNDGDGIINATHNYWGTPDGPSSPDPTRPLADPLTKRLADGHGAALSERPGGGAVANVHFDPFDGTPPDVEMAVEGTCDQVDPDGKSIPQEDADNDSVYGTLQDAENAATPDTKILVVECTYHQSATIDTAGLVLQSFKKVVFEGESNLASGLTVRADDVTIRGLEFHNYSRAGVTIVDSDAKLVNTVQRGNGNGSVIYGQSTPHLEANWFHGNTHAGVYLASNATVAAPDLTIVRNRIQGNGKYGIHNANLSAVVDATHNHWGAFDAPSSPHDHTLADPETGGLANGTGDAISAGTDPDVANVHFDPYNVVHYRWDIDYLVDDGTDCEADFTSIQAAEKAANQDDTVVVCAGTYDVGSIVEGQSGLTVNTKDLTLRGSRYAPDKPTIRGELTISGRTHDDLVVRGFRITGPGHGIIIPGAGDFRGHYYGISYGIKILQNNIAGNVRGIHLPDSNGAHYVLVTNNTISGNLYGVSCTAKECNHRAAQAPVVGGPASGPGEPWRYTVVMNNLIGNNTYYGIHRADTAGWIIGINNTWVCGGPSGGWNDPKTAEPADGNGDRITRNTRFDPFSVTDAQSTPLPGCVDPSSQLPPVVNNSAPTVDRLTVGEVETDSAAATFDATWEVNDSDDNLKEVRLRLHDDTAGVTDDKRTIRVVGQGSASSTTRLRAPGDDGSGHNYTVTLTVEDVPGKTAADAESIQETEPTSNQNDSELGWPSTPAETSTPPPGDGGSGPGSQGTGPGSGGQDGNKSDGGGSGEGTGTASSGSSASTAEATNSADALQVTEQVTLTGTPPPSTPTPPTDTPTPRISPTPEIIPGFGVSAWLIGFVTLLALGAIRRRRD